MDNTQKAAMLKTWATQMERKGASLRDVLIVWTWADEAAAGTLLRPDTTPVNWPHELECRREILDLVQDIQSVMTPDGAALLTPWINEIHAAVKEAEQLVVELPGTV